MSLDAASHEYFSKRRALTLNQRPALGHLHGSRLGRRCARVTQLVLHNLRYFRKKFSIIFFIFVFLFFWRCPGADFSFQFFEKCAKFAGVSTRSTVWYDAGRRGRGMAFELRYCLEVCFSVLRLKKFQLRGSTTSTTAPRSTVLSHVRTFY